MASLRPSRDNSRSNSPTPLLSIPSGDERYSTRSPTSTKYSLPFSLPSPTRMPSPPGSFGSGKHIINQHKFKIGYGNLKKHNDRYSYSDNYTTLKNRILSLVVLLVIVLTGLTLRYTTSPLGGNSSWVARAIFRTKKIYTYEEFQALHKTLKSEHTRELQKAKINHNIDLEKRLKQLRKQMEQQQEQQPLDADGSAKLSAQYTQLQNDKREQEKQYQALVLDTRKKEAEIKRLEQLTQQLKASAVDEVAVKARLDSVRNEVNNSWRAQIQQKDKTINELNQKIQQLQQEQERKPGSVTINK